MSDDDFDAFTSWKEQKDKVPVPRMPHDSGVPIVDLKLNHHSVDNGDTSEARSVFEPDEDDEFAASQGFVSFTPKRAPPFGLTKQQVLASRGRAVAAIVLFVVLTVLFACLGTLTFWKPLMTYKTWVTIFVLVVMLSALVLDLWDISLTFFVANTVLLLAKVITIQDALAGFSNEGILSTAIMFVIARAIEKTRVLEWVVRVVLRRPRTLRSAMLRMLPASSFWSFWTNNTPVTYRLFVLAVV
jgi:hypothetical protein